MITVLVVVIAVVAVVLVTGNTCTDNDNRSGCSDRDYGDSGSDCGSNNDNRSGCSDRDYGDWQYMV